MQIDKNPRFSLPDLVDAAVDHFCANGAWVRRFVDETLRSTIYAVAVKSMSDGRRGRRVEGEGADDEIVTELVARPKGPKADALRQTLQERLKAQPVDWAPRWERHTEYDPTTRTYYRLLDGNPEQLEATYVARMRRAESEMRRAAFIAAVREPMKPGQRVRDVWAQDALDELARKYGINDSGDAPESDNDAAAGDEPTVIDAGVSETPGAEAAD